MRGAALLLACALVGVVWRAGDAHPSHAEKLERARERLAEQVKVSRFGLR